MLQLLTQQRFSVFDGLSHGYCGTNHELICFRVVSCLLHLLLSCIRFKGPFSSLTSLSTSFKIFGVLFVAVIIRAAVFAFIARITSHSAARVATDYLVSIRVPIGCLLFLSLFSSTPGTPSAIWPQLAKPATSLQQTDPLNTEFSSFSCCLFLRPTSLQPPSSF